MFKYVTVDFPETTLPPQTVYSLTLKQARYSHEIVTVRFKDWGADFDVVSPGSPVHIRLASTTDTREFYGYVHDIKVDRTPGKFFNEVTFISASFAMKQQRQTYYTDVTADIVVKNIADSYKFASYIVPHPRVYPQIAQAGHSDWEMMVRLAKQCGYTLRTQNTELYFQPVLDDYTNYRASAPKFTMRDANHPDGSNLYSFNPQISESMPYEDAQKAAVAVSGVDTASGVAMSVAQQLRNKKIRSKQQLEFFDKFDTHTVAPTTQDAQYEAEAAENRNYFPYRASAEVLGTPNLRPDMPVFIDGVGNPYAGYWIVLEAEHMVVEKQRNVYVYTTKLKLGSDSLGNAETWTDTFNIQAPEDLPRRTIVPGLKQTNIKPETKLDSKFQVITPSNKGSFGTIENRAKYSDVNVRSIEPSTWRTTTPVLNQVYETGKTNPAITDRLVAKYGLL